MKENIYMNLYEFGPINVPNVSHMSHREHIRPFANMIDKLEYQAKKFIKK